MLVTGSGANLPERDDDTAERGDDTAEARLKRLLTKGLPIAESPISAAAGAAIGSLAGPAGAVIGSAVAGAVSAAVSTAIKKLGYEMAERSMGPREEARVGAVFAWGAADIFARTQDGEQIRADGFFDEGTRNRSDAEEVWESLLAKCQREASERKLPYMGYLFAGLAFDDSISLDRAHQIIAMADRLSYRQLCILRIAVLRETLELRSESYESGDEPWVTIPLDVSEVLYEYYELYNMGLVGTGAVISGLPGVVPGEIQLQGLGTDVYNLMKLWHIPDNELHQIVECLRQ